MMPLVVALLCQADGVLWAGIGGFQAHTASFGARLKRYDGCGGLDLHDARGP